MAWLLRLQVITLERWTNTAVVLWRGLKTQMSLLLYCSLLSLTGDGQRQRQRQRQRHLKNISVVLKEQQTGRESRPNKCFFFFGYCESPNHHHCLYLELWYVIKRPFWRSTLGEELACYREVIWAMPYRKHFWAVRCSIIPPSLKKDLYSEMPKNTIISTFPLEEIRAFTLYPPPSCWHANKLVNLGFSLFDLKHFLWGNRINRSLIPNSEFLARIFKCMQCEASHDAVQISIERTNQRKRRF